MHSTSCKYLINHRIWQTTTCKQNSVHAHYSLAQVMKLESILSFVVAFGKVKKKRVFVTQG